MAIVDISIQEIFEEAYEQCGLELRAGYDLRSLRRSLNILLIEWANKGYNMWTVEEGTTIVNDVTPTYVLDADTIDLIETMIIDPSNQNNVEMNLERISVSTYSQISNKTQQGLPSQIYVDRVDPPRFTLWPWPQKTYWVKWWRLRRMNGLPSGTTGTLDLPFRFVPALIAGLAYYTAVKRQPDRIQEKKQIYDMLMGEAMGEDRERASFRMIPWMGRP